MGKNKGNKKNKVNTNKNGANTDKKGTDSVKEDENNTFASKDDDVSSDNKSKEDLGSEGKSSNKDGCDGDSSGGDNKGSKRDKGTEKAGHQNGEKNNGHETKGRVEGDDRWGKINKILSIITACSTVFLFVIKQVAYSRNGLYYNIPSIYFNDLDLSSFLIILLIPIIITAIIFYPLYGKNSNELLAAQVNFLGFRAFITLLFAFLLFLVNIGIINIFTKYGNLAGNVTYVFLILITTFYISINSKVLRSMKVSENDIKKKESIDAEKTEESKNSNKLNICKKHSILTFLFIIYYINVYVGIIYPNIEIVYIIGLIVSFCIAYYIKDILILSIKEDNVEKSGSNKIDSSYSLDFIYGNISTLILMSLVIISVVNSDIVPQLRKEYEIIDSYNTLEAEKSEDTSWELLKDRVVISHYKDKLVVMDGIMNGDELIVLKPGFMVIDGSDINLSTKVFKKTSIDYKKDYTLNLGKVQKINDEEKCTQTPELMIDDILGEEYSINIKKELKNKQEELIEERKKTKANNENPKNDLQLNKFVIRVLGNGNLSFYDVKVTNQNEGLPLKDGLYKLTKTDKGFCLSLTKDGINVLNENQDGIKIGYNAKVDSDINDLDRNIIATSFDYGFNNDITRTNKYGKSKDGKIDLSVSWDGLSDGDKNINSIFVLQEKTSRDWVDVSYFATDSVKDSHYIFDGLDDNKLYRIVPIISESFDSDCVRFQDGEAEIVNIKSDEDFIKNKVYIQEFNIKNDYNKKTDNKEQINKVSKSSVKTGIDNLFFDKFFYKFFLYF